MSPPPFLVFDLDGTLSDPAVGIYRSINYALEHFGHSTIAEDDVAKYIGPPIDLSFRTIIGDSSPAHIATLVSKYRERYAEIGYSENVLYPGVPEALNTLALAGIPMGLCTAKRADFAERILKLFGLQHHFRFLSGGDIGIHKKQQLRALLDERMMASTSIMIGDRAFDIDAAKFNGLGSVGVLWGYGCFEELTMAGPNILLASPHHLEELKGVDLNVGLI